MRPKLLERFEGYVCDTNEESFFVVSREKGEQLEVPVKNLDRIGRENLMDGRIATVLIYDTTVKIRFLRKYRWTRDRWRRHLAVSRKWVKRHWKF